MEVAIGSFTVHSRQFSSYDELREFVRNADVEHLLLGENAAYFGSFWALEGKQSFGGSSFRVGIILDHNRHGPSLFAGVDGMRFAIGLNSEVVVLTVDEKLTAKTVSLDSWFQCFLHQGHILVAVHELGAIVLKLPSFDAIGSLDCEIVSEAKLTSEELILSSLENVPARLDLTSLS